MISTLEDITNLKNKTINIYTHLFGLPTFSMGGTAMSSSLEVTGPAMTNVYQEKYRLIYLMKNLIYVKIRFNRRKCVRNFGSLRAQPLGFTVNGISNNCNRPYLNA